MVVVLAVPFFSRKRNFDFFDGCFWGEFLGLSTWVFHSEVSLKYKFEISFNIVCRLWNFYFFTEFCQWSQFVCKPIHGLIIGILEKNFFSNCVGDVPPPRRG